MSGRKNKAGELPDPKEFARRAHFQKDELRKGPTCSIH